MTAALIVQANALHIPMLDESVDLIVTSPPYFALRSYRDGDEHYADQIGSEATPTDFLEALWAVTAEMVRVLKPSGSIFVNLGDKYSGSGGHNNSNITGPSPKSTLGNPQTERPCVGHSADSPASRRNAPDRYNQNSGGIPTKSLMGLPWRYAIGCIDRLGLILRAEIVWSKPNGLPESVTDRVRRSHETWFHFTRQGRYFASVDEVREAHNDRAGGPERFGNITKSGSSRTDGVSREQTFMPSVRDYNPLGKLPGSVWTVPSEPLIVSDEVKRHYNLPDHFAAFPQELPRRIILGWSPSSICTACGEGRRPVVVKVLHEERPTQRNLRTPRQDNSGPKRSANGHNSDSWTPSSTDATITGYACACPDTSASTRASVVLDCFGGTGTTAGVARALGRIGVSVDLSHDYCRLADWRIHRSGHFAKTSQRTHKENQADLFGASA